eukprot:COSAG01_NODE_618_length_14800_cov_11.772396_4_plen_377_part_00
MTLSLLYVCVRVCVCARSKALAFQVPTIGYPVVLMRFSAWLQSAFDLDLGQFLSTPECNVDVATLPVTVLTYKLLTSISIIVVLAATLAIVGGITGDVNHAMNASIAVYTVGMGMVVNRCLRALDCVAGNLVALPEQQCWQGEAVGYHAVAIFGIVLYCLCVPLFLILKLRAGVIASSDGIGDDEAEHAVFQKTFGWCFLKYKPDSWGFEVKLLAYKTASMAFIVLFASGWLVLLGLALVTGLLALDVWRHPPFLDGDQTEGWTEPDRVQLFSLLMLLFGFAVGAVSKLIGDVTGAVGGILALLGACALIAPVVYRFSLPAAQEGADNGIEDADVRVDNPATNDQMQRSETEEEEEDANAQPLEPEAEENDQFVTP